MRSLLGRTVLLVSRQPTLRRQLRVLLNRYGGTLVECRSEGEVCELLVSRRPELILLDSSAHDAGAPEAIRFVRAHTHLPLIALVLAHDEPQKLEALTAGADDWLTLPLASSELLARMRTSQWTPRPAAGRTPDAFRAGALEVDFLLREVRLRGRSIHVTPTEFKLLRVLIESAGKVVTHERLLREVWGPAAIQQVRRLHVHMKQLRRKFELAPPFARYLIAEPAIGYCLWVPA